MSAPPKEEKRPPYTPEGYALIETRQMINSMTAQIQGCRYCLEAGTICSVCASFEARLPRLRLKEEGLARVVEGQRVSGLTNPIPERYRIWTASLEEMRGDEEEPIPEIQLADAHRALRIHLTDVSRCKCQDEERRCGICLAREANVERLKAKIVRLGGEADELIQSRKAVTA